MVWYLQEGVDENITLLGNQLCMNVYNWSKIYWYEKLTLTGGRHVHMYMWFTLKLTPPPLSSTNSSQNSGQSHCNVNDIYLLILEWGGGGELCKDTGKKSE